MPEEIADMPHEPALAEQFDDLHQQRFADTLGMWIFLATEVLLFGGIFAGYTVYRMAYPEAFTLASHHLSIPLGTINTAVLLGSSLMVALAVHAAQTGRSKVVGNMLAGALVLGTVFLGIKAVEYTTEWRHHLVPWMEGFNPGGAHPEWQRLYYVFYFIMTGTHAVHMIIGMAVLGVIAVKGWRGAYTAERYVTVEVAGLYWHFVDIVWVFLFPALYLIHVKQ